MPIKYRYGKPVDPSKFKLGHLDSIVELQQKTEQLARKYLPLATIQVNSCFVCDQSLASGDTFSIYHFQYTICSHCHHLNTRQRLTQAAENQFYRESSSYAASYTDPAQIKYRQEVIAGPKVEFILDQISGSKKTKHWLDVGCGIGDLVEVVHHTPGWQAVGIDISQQSIETGQKIFTVPLEQTTLPTYAKKIKPGTQDLVSFFGYFTVTSDLQGDLKRITKLLKDDGYLVIGESNADSFSTKLQRTYPDFSTRHIVPPHTIHQFSFDSLQYLLKKYGYKLVAYWNFGLDYFEFIKYQALLDQRFVGSPLSEMLQTNLNQFQNVIDTAKEGDYLLAVAQKITPPRS